VTKIVRTGNVRDNVVWVVFLAFGCALGHAKVAAAPATPQLSGQWTLNRDLSQFPSEIGFGALPLAANATGGGRGGGGGGRRGGGGGQAAGGAAGGSNSSYGAQPLMESEEDSNKIKELIADAKNPSPILTITQTDSTVTITDADGHRRTYHPNGKEQTVQLAAGPLGATPKWDKGRLVIDYAVEKQRSFRYVYSRSPEGQLVVETRLEDKPGHEAGNIITRVYDSR
jgi:hypothetical protein